MNFKGDAVKRIKIAQGHLKKVEQMLAEDVYCMDVIHQSRAVQAALKKVDEIVLHGHLHTCVMQDLHGNKAKNEKAVDEIVELFRRQA